MIASAVAARRDFDRQPVFDQGEIFIMLAEQNGEEPVVVESQNQAFLFA